LRSHFDDKMFKTIVSFNTKLKEAASFGQPISEYDPASKGRKDFSALAEEIVGSQATQQRHEFVNSLAEQLESISATADELLEATKPSTEAEEAVEALEIEQTEPQLSEEEFVSEEMVAVAEDIEIDLTEELEAAEEPAVPTAEQRAAAKLSDYYGVSQINDAVVFVTLYPRAQSVQIAGDFNNWQPENAAMQKVGDTGVWQTKMNLPQGRYRYRLVVDGQWQQDPYNEVTELNPFGGFNSVVEIK
ncbi:MAG: glycogen-binding domain-containing protein, partial [Planctomycetota bacterium]